ncbi:MAG: lysophospholipase L1-like esterase [Saprospiraceae bacterium]|jgi:lysophospholipase L1-like esterase
MIKINLNLLSITLVFFFLLHSISAQDPLRFEKEIRVFSEDDKSIHRDKIIVFTGSSSVRLWTSLQTDFPEYNIINRGFGGSHMSDLLYYSDQLIIQYKPEKVFIYEGDNDISAEEPRQDILKEAKDLVEKIWEVSPDTKIYFISPKPSVARWGLRGKYEQFNYALSLWTLLKSNVTFIDVWTPMLNNEGEVMPDLFIGDNLHMNAKGYKIWADVIAPYLEDD